MPSSDRGKIPKIPRKKQGKPKEIENASLTQFFLEFMQTYNDLVETLEKDKENLMNSLNTMKIIISQRYSKEPEIVKIMNKLELEVEMVTTRMKLKAEEDFSQVIERQPCQACQGAGRT